MKKTVALGVAGAVCAFAGIAAAADWPGACKYVAKDASAFVNAEDPSTPFVMGEGMLLYTGSSTLTDVAMTFNVASGYGANTFNVENAETTLTLAGPFSQVRGAFLKTGPGTLALTYPGYQRLGPGPAQDGLQNRDTKWDETTGACTNGGYTCFTIDDGTLVLGTPGNTNYVQGMALIGNRSQKNVRLLITNGVFRSKNNWFCVARGTGQEGNSASAEVYVGKDAVFTSDQLNLGYENGVSSSYPRPRFVVDGGTAEIASQIYTLETGSGKAEVVITNGAKFASWESGWNGAGWRMKNGDGGTASVTVSAGSTARARYVGMRPGTTLLVNGGSKFLFDRMLPMNASLGSIGTVSFDGSTLGVERSGDAH